MKRALPIAGLALLLIDSSGAMAGGYWTCNGHEWTKAGNPAYPMPSRICAPPKDYPSTPSACAEVGGLWGPAGLSQQLICTLQTHDAGQVCGDSGECEGACLVDLDTDKRAFLSKAGRLEILGQCSARSPQFGCQAIVHEGAVTEVLCRD